MGEHSPIPQTEHRRVSRHSFTAPAVVTNTQTERILCAHTRELSQFGCLVQTATPFDQGTHINLGIVYSGSSFKAFAQVAYVTDEGMGIVFSTVETNQLDILQKWLKESSDVA
jgi:hypothetical protein